VATRERADAWLYSSDMSVKVIAVSYLSVQDSQLNGVGEQALILVELRRKMLQEAIYILNAMFYQLERPCKGREFSSFQNAISPNSKIKSRRWKGDRDPIQ
jgi:hypothetical protein